MSFKMNFVHLTLASMFLFGGCAEQVLENSTSDTVPSTTSGEETFSGVKAQFSSSIGRVPQPSDLILNSLNSALVAAGGTALTGVNRQMPIRIPFSGSLASLYSDNGSWNSTNGLKLAQNLLIFPSDNASAVVTPWPKFDKANNSVTGGKFKAVQQDSNHDLVLVPDSDTFVDNKTYVVVVKKSLGDSSGNNLGADILGEILVSPNKIVENNQIKSALVKQLLADEADGGLATATGLETMRSSYNLIANSLIAAGQIESHLDLAILFTFKTEEVNPTISAATATLISNMQTTVGNSTTAFLADPVWDNTTSYSAYLGGVSLAPSTDNSSVTGTNIKDNLSTVLTAAGVSVGMDNISAIYKGYFPCQNFLADNGTDTVTGKTKWVLDLANKASNPGTDCPNSVTGMTGKIGFLIARPTNVTGAVIYQNGITRQKDDFIIVANTLALFGFSTIAIDIWGHGERIYEDSDGDGTVENKFGNYENVGPTFLRFDNPSLAVGYIIQSQMDLLRLGVMIQANSEIRDALGLTGSPTTSNIHILSHSLGGIITSKLAASGSFPANKFLLSVTGGDIADIVLSGYFGTVVKAGVISSYGYDTSTASGLASLNSTLTAIDLSVSHAVFAGSIDPLTANRTSPNEVLVQQITNDLTVPNQATELYSQVVGLKTFSDGDGQTDNSSSPRSRWILDPSNYSGGDALHGFLIDGESTATTQGQLQAVCYFKTGRILDPSKTIDASTCSN